MQDKITVEVMTVAVGGSSYWRELTYVIAKVLTVITR
jgi:hypothetical protein